MIAGVVGCGIAGRLHLKGYLAHPDVQRVVVYDPGVRVEAGDRVTAVDDMDAFWAAAPQLVSVCTPPSSHGGYVMDALAHRAHVLCEKPLAFHSSDTLPWIERAAQQDLLLAAAFGHRFFAPTRRLKALIDAGELGAVSLCWNRFAVNYQRNVPAWKWAPAVSGGGALLDALLHSVDLYRYLLGEPADMALTARSSLPSRFGGVEDGAAVLVSGPGSATGVLVADWTTPKRLYELRVFGTKSWARVDFDAPALTWGGADDVEPYVETFPGTALDRFVVMVGEFVDAALGRRQLANPIADGVVAMRWVEGAYRVGSR
jgi:predicted dehydrogenase